MAYYTSKYSGEEIDALLDGKAVPIKGVYPSLDSLKAEFPNGADGLYQTSDTGNLYVWNAKKQEWESLGNIVGPAGPRGAVIVPSVSPDGVISFREESGEVTLPEPVNVKGPQGVSVQSARIDESGDLILTLTDAQVINAGRAIGPEGAKGATGASIDRIERTEGTGAPGSIDTYTVHLTDGATTTFQVYNGKDGDGAGDMVKAVYDPTGKEQDIFAYSVPQTRKINKKPLSADVTLTGEDIKVTGSDETTICTRLSEITNPNLLDNWYFVGGGETGQFPINQRGRTEYTGDVYGIDRWRGIYGGEKVTLKNSWSSFEFSGNQGVKQEFDKDVLTAISGNYCTISIIWRLFSGSYANFGVVVNGEAKLIPPIVVSENFVLTSLTLDLSAVSALSGYMSISGDGVIDAIACKLEVGRVQTLAHQENGKWVLNEIPDYGEQLQRCQRYFRRFPANYMIGGFQNNTTAVFRYPCTPPMRTTPALVLQDASDLTNALDDGTSPLTPASVVLNWLSNPETIGFYFTGTTQNTCCLCNRYVDVSADL